MKKWFMLTLLPLLLLAQQEVGATPLPPETLVSTFVPTDDTQRGYTAIFRNRDTDAVVGYDYTDITVFFDPRTDLTVARELIRNPSAIISLSDVHSNTLMGFSTIDPISSFPLLTLLALSATDPVTKNPSNVGNLQLGDAEIGPMTAFYNALDQQGSNSIPQPGQLTCMDLGTPPGNGTSVCAPIVLQAVPAPTSLMLLGIGLLALSVPQRRGRLS